MFVLSILSINFILSLHHPDKILNGARSIKVCPMHLKPNCSLWLSKEMHRSIFSGFCRAAPCWGGQIWFWLRCQEAKLFQCRWHWFDKMLGANTIVGIAEKQIQQNAQSMESWRIDSSARPQCSTGRWVDEVPRVLDSSPEQQYSCAFISKLIVCPLSFSFRQIHLFFRQLLFL